MAFNCGCGERMYCTDSKGRHMQFVYRRYRCKSCGATIRTEERIVEDAHARRQYEKWDGERWVTTTVRELKLNQSRRAMLQEHKIIMLDGVLVRLIGVDCDGLSDSEGK